jgi:LmbE family N-acetylglucosaminyl deacetylase
VESGPGKSGGTARGTGIRSVLQLSLPNDRPLRVLALGAHSDDIEIGCGGTLLSLLQQRPRTEVRWIVFSASGAREEEARRSAEAFLEGAGKRDVCIGRFRDGFMPYDGAAVKEYFESLKGASAPDLIFTHRVEDRHQDHRLLAELTWNTFRDHLVLEYEIPKYEGDLGHPNVFVSLDPPVWQRKVDLLMTVFGTQRSRRWFTEEVFTSLMRLRGMEAGLAGGCAEAFYVRKLMLNARAAAD